jgi:hypothetical protein
MHYIIIGWRFGRVLHILACRPFFSTHTTAVSFLASLTAQLWPIRYHQLAAAGDKKLKGEWERFENYDEDDLWGERLFVVCVAGAPTCAQTAFLFSAAAQA